MLTLGTVASLKGARLRSNTAINSILDSLQTETDGMLLEFISSSQTTYPAYALIRDTVTPANDFDGDANSKLTYTAPSAKYVMNSSGVLVSGTTLRCDHNSSGTPLGLLVEEARTNLCLQSDDFTNASWTKSNMNTAKTATGPDGVANSASTLTATAGNATALQAITSASAARVTSCYIKRRTGTGNIDLTQNNGTNWTTVTVTSSWTRVSLAAATLTNPTVGIRIVTSGDAVDVALFQHEVGSFITSPIRTTSATVTRAADNITMATSAFAFDAANMTLVAKFDTLPLNQVAWAVGLNTNTFNNQFAIVKANVDVSAAGDILTAEIYDGTVTRVTALDTNNDGAVHTVAAARDATNVRASANGAAAVTGTTRSPAPTTLRLGQRDGSLHLNTHLMWVKILKRAETAAQLATDSAL